ncbi:hypothetical protein B566_EDAN017062, partial [Ephemera danica]
MELVSIETKAEQDAINTYVQSLGLTGNWIYTSGNKIGGQCNYTWGDGQPLTYTNWNPGDPANENTKECQLMIEGKWSDMFCSAVNFFMCEQVSGQTITTTTPCPYSMCVSADCNANMTWFDALTFCRKNGMDLVSIGSQEEQDAIDAELARLNILGNWVFTSGNKIGPICPYTWVDGSPMTFLNWGPGEPSWATAENCQMTTNKKWHDIGCTYVTYFVCEQLPGQTITTTTPCPYLNCTTAQCNDDIAAKDAAIKAVPAATLSPTTLSLTSLNGVNYYFESVKPMTWFNALTFCRTYGMDLVSIQSQAEQDAINSKLTQLGITGTYVFTSGNKIGPKCPYTWEDGSPLTYTNWQPAEPSQSLYENCHIVWYNKWWDLPCTSATFFICEQ